MYLYDIQLHLIFHRLRSYVLLFYLIQLFLIRISGRSIKDEDIRQLLRILEKALEKSSDLTLIEAPIICLTRIESLIRPVSTDDKLISRQKAGFRM